MKPLSKLLHARSIALGFALAISIAAIDTMADEQEFGNHHGWKKSPFVQKVRELTLRFKDVEMAVAEGYTIVLPCADGHNGGSMGVHYVNEAFLVDAEIDIARPEALMYEPGKFGKLKLVGVEYLIFEDDAGGPVSLEGRLFNFSGSPNRYGLPAFYELHVWAWRKNPLGTFADSNSNVSCDWQPLTSY